MSGLAALLGLAVEPWFEHALCAQTDPELFFPEKGGNPGVAKGVCATCPVAAECLDYAIAHGERFGIWGGLSERERRTVAKALDPSAPSDTGACGTYPKGYQRHRAQNEDPCEDCKSASVIYAEYRREHGSVPGPIDINDDLLLQRTAS